MRTAILVNVTSSKKKKVSCFVLYIYLCIYADMNEWQLTKKAMVFKQTNFFLLF